MRDAQSRKRLRLHVPILGGGWLFAALAVACTSSPTPTTHALLLTPTPQSTPTATSTPTITPTPTATPTPTPTPIPCVGEPKDAYEVCYFTDPFFGNVAYTETVDDAALQQTDGAPDARVPADGFAARWTGTFELEEGDYEFLVHADDGIVVRVDGVPVIHAWYPSAKRTERGVVGLGPGRHRVVLEYFDASGESSVDLDWALLEPTFTYAWRADDTLTGEVRVPLPVPRPVVVVGGEPIRTLSSTAALRLADVDIVLADDVEPWDDFTASMLYETVRRLPDTRLRQFDAKPWRVSLTSEPLANDVRITRAGDGQAVHQATFAKEAFARSNPTLQPSAGGNADRVFFSNRLFRAVLRTFYNDPYLLTEILESRYGLKLGTGEPADEFQDFTVEEMRYLATVLEDLPSGFRSIPGLEKIVRRKNGLTNPTYPAAHAVAWVDLGYIEFMDVAFTSGEAAYIRRLIVHEMAHFLWHKVLDDDARATFEALSGWTKEPAAGGTPATGEGADHPKSSSVTTGETWYRATTTNFVSDYAAAINPDEDFAESIAYYVYEPDLARSRAPQKYAYVNDIVDGYEYVTLVDEQFTFQVFNLEPDVTFPGKIVGVDVAVAKSMTGVNYVTATLHLSRAHDAGAQVATARVFSPADTFVDVSFSPKDGDPFTLQAHFELGETRASGYWTVAQITVQDAVDNRRFEGQAQFGWQLYIDNPGEDLTAPVANVDGITSGLQTLDDGEQAVVVRVPLTDDTPTGLGGYATLQQHDSGQRIERYAVHDTAAGDIVFTFPIHDYRATGAWEFREFWTSDAAGNQGRYDLKEQALSFDVTTDHPDGTPPELDVSSIRIEAVPRKPEAPDGETDVTIWYTARDDRAGLGVISYRLLRPDGSELFDYHYHANFHTPYFDGNPTAWKDYVIQLTLPPGSPPGTWVLAELVLQDKAGNTLTSDFTETGILASIEVLGEAK